MPPEAAEPEAPDAQDTPTPDTEPEAPETTEDTPEAGTDDTNWQERYTEAQQWGTRASQEAAQYRQIIDLARQGDPEALEYLGYETPETDTEEGDPSLEDQLAELKAWKQEQEQAVEQNESAEYENGYVDSELQRLDDDFGREFTQEEVDWLDARSRRDRLEDGAPDVEGAVEALKALYKAEQQRLVSSKKNAPKAPVGAAGAEAIDTSTPEGRRAAIRDIAESTFASE